jgi:hypothetical protein
MHGTALSHFGGAIGLTIQGPILPIVFEIPVIEYESVRPGKNLASQPQSPFLISRGKLIVCTVRAILTVKHSKSYRKALAAIVIPTVDFMVDWSKINASPFPLCLSHHFQCALRDFSATSRIGEFAQGVNFAYWWSRGYIWITSYSGPSQRGSPSSTGKQPDFEMVNLQRSIALMEAKGTGSDKYQGPMSKALGQIRDGLKASGVTKGWGSVLAFQKNLLGGRAHLHVRDPENPGETSKEQIFSVFKRSYATWFELAGFDALSEWCKDDKQSLAEKMARNLAQSIFGHPLDGYSKGMPPTNENPLRRMVATALGFEPGSARFDIDPIVLAALRDIKVFEATDWDEFAMRLRSLPDEPFSAVHFPDGTSIFRN